MTRLSKFGLFVIVTSAAIVCGCSSSSGDFIDTTETIVGSGVLVQEDRVVTGFNRVLFATEGSVTIEVGATEGVEITTDDNLLAHLVTEVQGGELLIRADPSNVDLEPTLLEFRITVLDLASFTLAGVASVDIADLTTGRLDLTLAGVGGFDLPNLDVDELHVEHVGVGGFDFSGTAGLLDITMTGIQEVDAYDLLALDADVTLTGVG
jgi:hypothetical protein